MLLQMTLPNLRQQAILHIAQTFHVTRAFAEKRLALFEQRRAGIQFQKEFTSYLMRASKVAENEATYQTKASAHVTSEVYS